MRDAATRALAKQFGTLDLAALRRRRGAAGRRRRRRAAGLRRSHAAGPALAHVRALAVERASEFVALDPATRRNLEINADAARRRRADAALAARPLRAPRRAAGCCAQWLHASAARPRRSAPRGTTQSTHCCADRRASRALADALHAHRRRRAHRRAHRAAQRAPARSRGPARHARARCPRLRERCAGARRAAAARRRARRSRSTRNGARCCARARAEPARAAARRRRHRGRLRRRARRAARASTTNCGEFLVELEARERARTGIANLKVEYNRVHGFYIEVTNAHVDEDARRLPPPADAEERRALHHAGAEGVRGQGAVGAGARAGAREAALRTAARRRCAGDSGAAASRRARSPTLDVLANLAERAQRARARAARRSPPSPASPIDGGRHPVVERAGRAASSPNDVALDARAPAADRHRAQHGRQVDLHAAGGGRSRCSRTAASFVPATRAAIGPLDAIYTRIGASDDLAGGRSTFMVEMTEAAYILQPRHAAEPRADRRNRARHVDVRRPGAGVGDRAPPGRAATAA